MQDTITRAIADRWAGEKCYLNGAPATVRGRLLPFAKITPQDERLAAVEYSWHTVQRIMERGGFFD